MPDRVFIDSNLWIYLFVESKDSRANTENIEKIILTNARNIFISNQVLNEFSNVLLKKYNATSKDIKDFIANILALVEVNTIDKITTFQALDLVDRYSIAFYDALIVSSALFSGCNILYTEDMHHNQLIENKVRIINPFKE